MQFLLKTALIYNGISFARSLMEETIMSMYFIFPDGKLAISASDNSKAPEDKPEQKKSTVRVSSEHKEQIVMDDFKTHEMPKMVGEVASVLSLITNTNQPVGNTYNFLAKLLKDKKLLTYETKVKNKPRVYYGLPHWFEVNGKKLKAEFLKKLK